MPKGKHLHGCSRRLVSIVKQGTYWLQAGICRHMMRMHLVTVGHHVYSPFEIYSVR